MATDEELNDGWSPELDADIARGYHRVPDQRGGYIEELPVLVTRRRWGKDTTELVMLRISVNQKKKARGIDAQKQDS